MTVLSNNKRKSPARELTVTKGMSVYKKSSLRLINGHYNGVSNMLINGHGKNLYPNFGESVQVIKNVYLKLFHVLFYHRKRSR